MSKPNQGYITCWAIVYHDPYGYTIIGHHGLENYNKDHPNHKFIRTSPIVNMSPNLDKNPDGTTDPGFDVETLNSIYHVRGLPNPQNGRELFKAIYGRYPEEPNSKYEGA